MTRLPAVGIGWGIDRAQNRERLIYRGIVWKSKFSNKK